MNELAVHPNVYATGRSKGLLTMLETLWLREQSAGDGTMYIVPGFANYNGGSQSLVGECAFDAQVGLSR